LYQYQDGITKFGCFLPNSKSVLREIGQRQFIIHNLHLPSS